MDRISVIILVGKLSGRTHYNHPCPSVLAHIENSRYSSVMDVMLALKALANPIRLQILNWLMDPHQYFSGQEVGDLDADGVCVSVIQRRLNLSQSTVSQYLTELQRAGLVKSKRLGQWTYYRRDEAGIRQFLDELERMIGQGGHGHGS
jgi:DNA-binding transcriptional ArsR family regulator